MERLAASPSFVGIDVSKDRLDVNVRPSGRAFAVVRDGKGLDQLVIELRSLAPALIVLEATGGFEITVAAALASAGLPLAVVNPRQIRDFARATGRLAKTDVLDAQVIALFAERIRPEPRPLADADSQRPSPTGSGKDRQGNQSALSGPQFAGSAYAQDNPEDTQSPARRTGS